MFDYLAVSDFRICDHRGEMTSNRHKGAEFAEHVRAYLKSQGLDVDPEYEAEVSINRVHRKMRKFDWGNESVLVECKAYDWTASGNNPSAKLTTANEAMLYFVGAPESHRKMLFLAATGRRSGRRAETLGEYYVRTYAHLIPDDVEVHELNPDSLSARQLWPAAESGGEVSIGTQSASLLVKSGNHEVASRVFHLKLGQTFYSKGFFNVSRRFDDLVGDEGSVTLVLRDDQPIEGKINRTANLNGTARIIGGVVLRDWFRRTYSEGDRVEVRFETPRCLVLG